MSKTTTPDQLTNALRDSLPGRTVTLVHAPLHFTKKVTGTVRRFTPLGDIILDDVTVERLTGSSAGVVTHLRSRAYYLGEIAEITVH